jgi:hypothetical protein
MIGLFADCPAATATSSKMRTAPLYTSLSGGLMQSATWNQQVNLFVARISRLRKFQGSNADQKQFLI